MIQTTFVYVDGRFLTGLFLRFANPGLENEGPGVTAWPSSDAGSTSKGIEFARSWERLVDLGKPETSKSSFRRQLVHSRTNPVKAIWHPGIVYVLSKPICCRHLPAIQIRERKFADRVTVILGVFPIDHRIVTIDSH